MVKEIIMPKLGQTVEEAVIQKWLKKEGDRIAKGDVLLEIVTDKAALEVESFHDGILRKILAKDGSTVPVLSVIGYVADSMDEKVPGSKPSIQKPKETEAKVQEVKTEAEEETISSRARVSPLAKRLAQELNVDISKVTGTGPDGRITKEDILAASKGSAGVGKARKIPLSPMRKIIAENMVKSKREIPHFYLTAEVDMTECVGLREKLNTLLSADKEELLRKNKPKYTFNDFIIKAIAKSLQKYPHINCRFVDNSIQITDEINVGFAVALSSEDGLIVPVVHLASQLSLEEIIVKRDELTNKARGKKLTPDEMSGAQIVISNLGMYEITNFTAVIPPTASSILAIGKIEEKPVVKDGKVIVRSMMSITGSFDHRAIDGAYAALFLQEVKTLLEEPQELID